MGYFFKSFSIPEYLKKKKKKTWLPIPFPDDSQGRGCRSIIHFQILLLQKGPFDCEVMRWRYRNVEILQVSFIPVRDGGWRTQTQNWLKKNMTKPKHLIVTIPMILLKIESRLWLLFIKCSEGLCGFPQSLWGRAKSWHISVFDSAWVNTTGGSVKWTCSRNPSCNKELVWKKFQSYIFKSSHNMTVQKPKMSLTASLEPQRQSEILY